MAEKTLKSITFPNLSDTYIIPEIVVDSALSEASENAVQNKAVTAAIHSAGRAIAEAERLVLGAYPTDTASGDLASFPDGGDDIPVKALTVAIEPVQEGSGDPSPDNIRPIAGFTGVKVTRAGRNLLEIAGSREDPYYDFSVTDGVLSVEIKQVPVATGRVDLNTDVYLRPGAYILSSDGGDEFVYIQLRHADDTTFINTRRGSTRFAITKSGHYKCAFLYSAGAAVGSYTLTPMIRLAADADKTFEPYRGKTYAVAFPTEAGTVYGGTLDVTAGTLTVEYAAVTLTGSTALTAVGSAGNTFYFPVSSMPIGAAYTSAPVGLYSDKLSPVARSALHSVDAFSVAYDINMARLQVRIVGVLTAAEAKTWLAQNPVQIVYKLAAPVAYQLTPQEVTTLQGGNNLWSDGGTVDLTYRADPTRNRDKYIAELQALILER